LRINDVRSVTIDCLYQVATTSKNHYQDIFSGICFRVYDQYSTGMYGNCIRYLVHLYCTNK
jgi:hypothetical protein